MKPLYDVIIHVNLIIYNINCVTQAKIHFLFWNVTWSKQDRKQATTSTYILLTHTIKTKDDKLRSPRPEMHYLSICLDMIDRSTILPDVGSLTGSLMSVPMIGSRNSSGASASSSSSSCWARPIACTDKQCVHCR